MSDLAEQVRALAAECDWRGKTLEETRAENDRLRAALACSDRPCIYCTLPAEEWNKCADGFPGCARADDAVGCPHLGAGLEEEKLRDALNKVTLISTKALEGGNHMQGLVWIKKACNDAGFTVVTVIEAEKGEACDDEFAPAG